MKRYLFLLLAVLPGLLSASSYYWVGGTGNWSDYANHWATTSGGLVFHVQEPTPFDDVFFDANSFPAAGDTVYINATIFTCHDMDWTGVTNAPVFRGASSTGQLEIYGSLTLAANVNWQYFGGLNMKSTSAGETVTSANQTLQTLLFTGATGGWTLQDSLDCHQVSIYNGTFNSNSMNTSATDINISALADADWGTSQIVLTGSWNASPGSTVDADSTTIFVNSSNLYGGNHVYHHVFFANSAYIHDSNIFDKVTLNGNFNNDGNNTFDTLYINGTGVTITLASGSTQTINNEITAGGTCSSPTTLKASSAGVQATISKASGIVTMSYLLMTDIDATGGATFNAVNSTPISNVTGWNVATPVPQNLYWVNGTGNWNDANHWSTTSGGSGGSCLPTQFDNVFFDANSFVNTNDSVRLNNAAATCNSMNWTGATGTPRFMENTGSLSIHGSLTFIPAMNLNPNGFMFVGTLPGNTITTAGHNLNTLICNGAGGDWTLQDPLICMGHISIYNGTFYSNSMSTSAGDVSITGIADAYWGTSNIALTSGWNVSPGGTVDADSTVITFSNGGGFYGGNHVYHNVTFNGGSNLHDSNTFDKVVNTAGNMSIDGNNVFDTLYINGTGVTITLGANAIQTIISDIAAGGTCSSPTTLHSSSAGTLATISKASGTVNMSYLLMSDIKGSGGATFNALSSTVISNVVGWNFTPAAPQALYWVNGTGNWNDANHWSTTSGGAGGSCPPTQFDDIFFDANSFPTAGDTVRVNVSMAACNNIDWTGATGTPFFSATGGNFDVHGSLTFIPAMTMNAYGFSMMSTLPGNTVTTAGHNMNTLQFNNTGDWTLQDPIWCSHLAVYQGTFYSSSMSTSAGDVFISAAADAYWGTSAIALTSGWSVSPGGTMDADSTVIIYAHGGGFYGGSHVYHNVTFNGGGYIQDSNTFDRADVMNTFNISGNNTFDTLYIDSPGQTVTLGSGYTQTINSSLQANATGGFPISLVSSSPGTQSTISMAPGDTACMNYIYMQDQNATGGGVFYAGIYSSNIVNNSGWLFTSCVQPISNVWPGDANYDLIANNTDILNIGIAMGETGFTRPGASNTYVAQPCLDWPSQFINGVNTKHADCDGNGVVNLNDTLAVSLNYGQTHPPRLARPDSLSFVSPDLYFQFPTSNVAPGSYVTVDIDLGTLALPASNVYGIAFTVNYPNTQIVAGTMSSGYNGSWLVSTGNNVHLEKNFFTTGKIDYGFSRIDHVNASGNGRIATLTFQVDPSTTGWLMLTFTNILAVDKDGNVITVNNSAASVFVGMNEHYDASPVDIFPNPSNGALTIDLAGEKTMEGSSIELLDLTGRVVTSAPANQQQLITLDLTAQPEGVYFVRIYLEDGSVLIRKLVVQSH